MDLNILMHAEAEVHAEGAGTAAVETTDFAPVIARAATKSGAEALW